MASDSPTPFNFYDSNERIGDNNDGGDQAENTGRRGSGGGDGDSSIHPSSGSRCSSIRKTRPTGGRVFPLHEAAFMGNVIEVEALTSHKNGDEYVLQLNSHQRTVLHECGRGDFGPHSVKIAQRILSLIPEQQIDGYFKEKDEDNMTALYYAVQNSNVALVDYLLETEAKLLKKFKQADDSGHFEPAEVETTTTTGNEDEEGVKSLLFLAVSNGSLEILKLLLKYGHKIQANEHGTLLREAVIHKNSTNHLDIFKFILEHIKQNDNDDEMEELQEVDLKLKYILHFASKCCNLKAMKILLNPNFGDDFPLLRKKGNFTPIHYVLKSWSDENFFEATRLLVTKCFERYDGFVLYEELYSCKDSPLNFAFGVMKLHNAPSYVVGVLMENVQNNTACWERLRLNERIVTQIYNKTPEILPKMINQSVKLVNLETVDIDFGLIIPVSEKPSTYFVTKTGEGQASSSIDGPNGQPETRYLRTILGKDASIQKSIISHPIVKLYLELKYKSFYAFNLFCCFIQILFLAAYTYLIPVKYSVDDDGNGNKTAGTTCLLKTPEKTGATQVGSPDISTNTNDSSADTDNAVLLYMLAVIVCIVYLIPIGIKEIWQIATYRLSYFTSLINLVQLTNLICVALVCLECYRNVTVLYPVAAISGLLSWVLFLRELSKIFTECNIWTSALLKVVTRSIKLAIYFLPLLIGFYLVFQVLIPWRNFNYWLSGLGHMLVLMTGEFEYDETFNGENKVSEGQLFLATASFMLFVMVTVISLSNLLVAVAVEDIAKLRRDSEFKSLASRLEYMHSVEIIYLKLCRIRPVKLVMNAYGQLFKVVSKLIMSVCSCLCRFKTKKRNISNLSVEIPIDGMLSISRNLFSEQELKDLNLI